MERGTLLAQMQDWDQTAELARAQAKYNTALEEREVALINPGASAGIKLESFPTKTFQGKVVIVSPKGEIHGEGRVFFARVEVANDDAALRGACRHCRR